MNKYKGKEHVNTLRFFQHFLLVYLKKKEKTKDKERIFPFIKR